MDAKHLLSLNPLKPAYRASAPSRGAATPLAWRDFEGGLVEIGHDGEGFAFDNEGPRHRVWLEPFALASRPTSCGEYLAFIEDGGYRRPEFWLSAGWDCVSQRGWDGAALLGAGRRELARLHPVGAAVRSILTRRSATSAASKPPPSPSGRASACRARRSGRRRVSALEDTGVVWEWTASPYVAYPGYREPAGAIGEYNGKFMANQMVLRGGCSATPAGHMRPTYRNFFPPDARWMFGGIRLAEDLR